MQSWRDLADRDCRQLLTYRCSITDGQRTAYANPARRVHLTRATTVGWRAARRLQADDARRGWFSPASPKIWLACARLYRDGQSRPLSTKISTMRRPSPGVSVDLHSYAGAIHAFNAIPDAVLSQRFNGGLLAAAAR
ncbi:hypothetical protein OVY29_16420 [Sphingopyxis sp. SE2]|uniref:hypothetical protein n=1 Tax=Sphingopyxis sp. SE2 TaxID=1586240 RepID=UPI0028BFDFB1|nr:hypothetical protein [Sphingopyxis sp. SE2]MDT7530245.1 hypothetical protein [Sphingopyxis sp. SE2]